MDSERFSWDERKRGSNLEKHGVDFPDVERFDFESAMIVVDDRKNYGEVRYRALGTIDGRLHALIFTARGAKVRVISLRRANDRERKKYVEAQENALDS